MKYFLTLLSVAVFATVVSGFGDNALASVFWKKGTVGNGDVTEQARTIEDFTYVKSSTGIEVELSRGVKPSAVVITDSNLQEQIMTEVSNGKLRIYVAGSVRNATEMKVKVTYTKLEGLSTSSASSILVKDALNVSRFKVESSSASSVNVKKIKAEKIYVDVSSAANVQMAGECVELDVEASSASDADLFDLEATECTADASSGADIDIHVKERLEAEATSGADINYKGNPKYLSKEKSSGGDVSKR